MRKLGLFLIALFLVFMVKPAICTEIEIQIENITATSVEKKSTGTVSFEIQIVARNFEMDDAQANIFLQAVDKEGNKLKKIKVRGTIHAQNATTISKKVSMPVKDYEAIEQWKVIEIDVW